MPKMDLDDCSGWTLTITRGSATRGWCSAMPRSSCDGEDVAPAELEIGAGSTPPVLRFLQRKIR
jgi:hypothetical protein